VEGGEDPRHGGADRLCGRSLDGRAIGGRGGAGSTSGYLGYVTSTGPSLVAALCRGAGGLPDQRQANAGATRGTTSGATREGARPGGRRALPAACAAVQERGRLTRARGSMRRRPQPPPRHCGPEKVHAAGEWRSRPPRPVRSRTRRSPSARCCGDSGRARGGSGE
jgi:hypothetical protein